MGTARGIHDLADRKLGLRPATPARTRLKLRNFLTGRVPPVPPAADHLSGLAFGLYQNDRFGVCGPVSLANFVRMATAKLTGTMVVPSQADVFDLYRRSGNPNFNPNTGADDNGVNMQTMLDAAVRNAIGGTKILGFAAVDVSDLDELDAAVAYFGGLLLGVNLQKAQQAQTDAGTWDYSPSSDWGGHAVFDGQYMAAGGHRVITWGKPVVMTDNFARHQQSEAWVPVLECHLRDDAFLQGVDVAAFARAFSDMTGKPFPAPIPPKPPSPPTPVPTPGKALTVGMSLRFDPDPATAVVGAIGQVVGTYKVTARG